jgi:hypothetical protein
MKAKSFRFGRLSTSQFVEKMKDLNEFLANAEVVGVPQVTANDEEGTVMFVFYNDKEVTKSYSKSKKETNEN